MPWDLSPGLRGPGLRCPGALLPGFLFKISGPENKFFLFIFFQENGLPHKKEKTVGPLRKLSLLPT